MKPIIETYEFTTALGKIKEDVLPFLTNEQVKELNAIGYTGKRIGSKEKTTRTEYLDSLGIGTFNIVQTHYDNGDFSESFILTRVITNKSELEKDNTVRYTVEIVIEVPTTKSGLDVKAAIKKGLAYGLDVKRICNPTQIEYLKVDITNEK